jgi:hypothetical protein
MLDPTVDLKFPSDSANYSVPDSEGVAADTAYRGDPCGLQPEVSQASGGSTGVGNTIAAFFLTPAHTGTVVWAVGPSLLIPTATDTNTSAGKWGLDPPLAFCSTAKLGILYHSGA